MATLQLETSASISPTTQHLLPFDPGMDKMCQEFSLPNGVAFSIYELFDDVDGSENFHSKSTKHSEQRYNNFEKSENYDLA